MRKSDVSIGLREIRLLRGSLMALGPSLKALRAPCGLSFQGHFKGPFSHKSIGNMRKSHVSIRLREVRLLRGSLRVLDPPSQLS